MPGTYRSLALFAALALTPNLARAADLGGDCCADLEARVANLEATVVTKGNRKVSLEISGRINANVMGWDDHAAALDTDEILDQSRGVNFGNTGDNETRLVFSGSGKITSDISAGFLLTTDYNFTGTDSQTSSQHTVTPSGDTTYVFVKSAHWGEYRLGNLPSASDDAYYVDFGSAATIGGLYKSVLVNGFFLRSTNVPGELTDVTYGALLGELPDSNDNRLMYISPTWNGFSYKSDFGTGTNSVALSWTGSAGSFRGAAAVGYQRSTGATALSPTGAQSVQTATSVTTPLTDANHDLLRLLAMSASVIETKSGLFLTGEYSRAYSDIAGRDDATNWFARAGWTKNVSGLGATTIDAAYQRTDNKLANGTSAHIWGVGIDQAIDAAASNIYLRYQHDGFDSNGAVTAAASASVPVNECAGVVPGTSVCTVDAQAIDSLTAGMIINF